jgi:hypothetical protein
MQLDFFSLDKILIWIGIGMLICFFQKKSNYISNWFYLRRLYKGSDISKSKCEKFYVGEITKEDLGEWEKTLKDLDVLIPLSNRNESIPASFINYDLGIMYSTSKEMFSEYLTLYHPDHEKIRFQSEQLTELRERILQKYLYDLIYESLNCLDNELDNVHNIKEQIASIIDIQNSSKIYIVSKGCEATPSEELINILRKISQYVSCTKFEIWPKRLSFCMKIAEDNQRLSREGK